MKYTLTRDDVWAFHRFHLYRKKRLLRGFDLLGTGVITIAWLFMGWVALRRALLVYHVFGGSPLFWKFLWQLEQRDALPWLLLTVYLIYLWRGNKWLALHRAVSAHSLAETKTMRLTDAGVQITTASGKADVAWSGIREITGDRQRLYLYVGPANALIVPRRAFDAPEAAARFEETARSYKSDPYGSASPAPADVWPPPPSRVVTSEVGTQAASNDAALDDAPGVVAVSYVTRRSDLWRSALLLARRRPASLLNLFVPCLFPATVLIVVSHWPLLPVLGLSALLWALLVGNWLRTIVVNRLPDPKAARACRSLLRPDGFVDIMPEGRSVLPWSQVGEIFSFLGDLHLTRKGGVGGSFIPRTAFATASEARQFLETMRRLQDAAQKAERPKDVLVSETVSGKP